MPTTRPTDDTLRVEFIRGKDDDDVNADDIPITDVGGFFTATDVEGALQELGPGGSGVTLSDNTPLVDAGAGDPGVGSEASRDDHVHPSSAGASAFKGAVIHKTSSQTIGSGSFVYVTFNSSVRDDDGWANLGLHNDRLTVPYDCAIEIFAMGYWESSATNERELYIEVDGTSADYSVIGGVATAPFTHVAHVPYIEVATGQLIKVAVSQFTGSNKTFGDNGGVDAYIVVRVLELL